VKVQKIVSLDENTAPIAQSMSNFSGWVRKMLQLHDNGIDLVELEENRAIWVLVARQLATDDAELMRVLKEVKQGRIHE